MKKLTLYKNLGRTATVLLLCVAFLATCFAFLIPSRGAAFAAVSAGSSSIEVTSTSVKLEKECNYGKEFTVPGSATVYAPNGEEVTPTGGKVKALQVGNYKVRYTESGVSYDFFVRVKLEKDLILKITDNGADIPSIIEKGKSFKFPTASVGYYDDNKLFQELAASDYKVTVTDSRGNTYDPASDDAAKNTFQAGETAQKVYITYTAVVGGEGGTKHFSSTFETTVQATAPAMGNPTLTVSGVQKDVSINRAVTLPKATATDSIDTNVRVEITVTGPDAKPVKITEVDEDGYAKAPAEDAKDVKFDNDKSMTFYPTQLGTYTVRYTAYNDKNLTDPTSGKSSTREYYMTCSDLVAPVFKKVDEDLIPATWGKDIENGEGAEAVTGGKIKFTIPTVVDNKDHVTPKGDDDKDLISVYFRVYDSDNSKTVLTFQNILDTKGDDNKFTYDSTYNDGDNTKGQKVAFTLREDEKDKDGLFGDEDGFVFDFDKYRRTDKDGAEVTSKAGTYTVLYRARDKANNTSSKTYTITYQDKYTDKDAPTTAEVTVPEYLSAADKTFTVPNPTYADASDTRPQVTYRIYTDAEVTGDENEYLTVKGGEVADIVEETGKRYFVLNKDKEDEKKLLLGSKLYFYVGVQDKAGNFLSNAEDTAASKFLKPSDFDEAEDAALKTLIEKIDDSITVVPTAGGEFTYTGAISPKNAADKSTNVKAGDSVNLGSFKIETASLDMRYYTGFEVSVYAPGDDNYEHPLNVTLETVSFPNAAGEDKAVILVQNITFNASVATKENEFYTVTVRVFDVNGNNRVYGYKVTGVDERQGGGVSTSAIQTIGSSGSVEVAYKLNNSVIDKIEQDPDAPNTKYYVVRKIQGGRFSLMGNEFVAKTQGSYSVQDGYIAEFSGDTFKYDDVKHVGLSNGTYNFKITDTNKPVFEIQGVMPTYNVKYDPENADTKVVLPKVIAYTETGAPEVKVEVFAPGSDSGFAPDEASGVYSFKGEKDGVYTVKYTASYMGESATAEYKISVGDVEGPAFELESDGSSPNKTLKVGDTFTFSTITLVDDKEKSTVTIEKRLVDPSHETVSDATVKGTYNSNYNKGNAGTDITLNMSGEYTVEYIVKDSVGNEVKRSYTITVMSDGSSTPTLWTPLSTVLIIVAVVLLAGVIVYVVRFRKVKK